MTPPVVWHQPAEKEPWMECQEAKPTPRCCTCFSCGGPTPRQFAQENVPSTVHIPVNLHSTVRVTALEYFGGAHILVDCSTQSTRLCRERLIHDKHVLPRTSKGAPLQSLSEFVVCPRACGPRRLASGCCVPFETEPPVREPNDRPERWDIFPAMLAVDANTTSQCFQRNPMAA